MNTETMAGSLVFAAVIVVVIGVLISLMLRGWRGRAQRQMSLIGGLPALPDTVGAVSVKATKGLYVGSTLAPSWQDRIAVGDLGYRCKAVLTRYPEGIMMQRSGVGPIWIPQESIVVVRTEKGIAGKVISEDAILVIRWRLPSGTEIETGFRGDNRDEYGNWIAPSGAERGGQE